MDKNTYEFLQTNSNDAETDQFFVVQDDGTFLINREVQYVAQVQDVKEVLEDVQPCTVYDVASQQFFVDVDSSAELISVSDQFILPDGDNNLYSNSYLLQPSTSTTSELMEEDVVIDQLKQPSPPEVNVDVVSQNSKQTNDCTEITLSDDQYQVLEQKGWILLESNDKIFVLNTLGLHDITTNDKLIEKLKNDVENNSDIDPGSLKIEQITDPYPVITQALSMQQDTVEFVIGNDNIAQNEDNIENLPFIIDEKVDEATQDSSLYDNQNIEISAVCSLQNNILEENPCIENHESMTDSAITIKTKLIFKDIPEKIFLGKTINGKRLVAKVMKTTDIKTSDVTEDKDNIHSENANSPKVVYEKIGKNQQLDNTGLTESQFLTLVQQSVRGDPQTNYSDEDVASMDHVISLLTRVPNLKRSVVAHNLIITKIINNEEQSGTIVSTTKPTLMTGEVTFIDSDNGQFVHLPNLLKTLMTKQELQSDSSNKASTGNAKTNKSKNNIDILHIHILETKSTDGTARVSVSLNKRLLSLDLILDLNKRHPNTVYACGACAAIFKSEKGLKDHQENQCREADDMLTIDTNNVNVSSEKYFVLKSGNRKMYSCVQCEATFLILGNCQRHVKTHSNYIKPQTSENDMETSEQEEEKKKRTNKVYQCKMCPSSYFHPSTLSKHIVARHIKVKST